MPEVQQLALVVDDDPDIAELVVMVLEGLDLEVVVAHTGARAIELARERPPDLVTLDLTLPDLAGDEVRSRLRRITGAPVIVVSGRDPHLDGTVDHQADADAYLPKPFSPRELRLRAAALLGRPTDGP